MDGNDDADALWEKIETTLEAIQAHLPRATDEEKVAFRQALECATKRFEAIATEAEVA